MNNTISIAPQLWFEETFLGGTLNFRTSDAPDAVHYQVGISFQSLRDLVRSFSQPACLWTIRDGSLTVYGDYEELGLTFCTVEGAFMQGAISLYGEELKIFKYAVNALAYRKEVALN